MFLAQCFLIKPKTVSVTKIVQFPDVCTFLSKMAQHNAQKGIDEKTGTVYWISTTKNETTRIWVEINVVDFEDLDHFTMLKIDEK